VPHDDQVAAQVTAQRPLPFATQERDFAGGKGERTRLHVTVQFDDLGPRLRGFQCDQDLGAAPLSTDEDSEIRLPRFAAGSHCSSRTLRCGGVLPVEASPPIPSRTAQGALQERVQVGGKDDVEEALLDQLRQVAVSRRNLCPGKVLFQDHVPLERAEPVEHFVELFQAVAAGDGPHDAPHRAATEHDRSPTPHDQDVGKFPGLAP
jgi:hypothetical protein